MATEQELKEVSHANRADVKRAEVKAGLRLADQETRSRDIYGRTKRNFVTILLLI